MLVLKFKIEFDLSFVFPYRIYCFCDAENAAIGEVDIEHVCRRDAGLGLAQRLLLGGSEVQRVWLDQGLLAERLLVEVDYFEVHLDALVEGHEVLEKREWLLDEFVQGGVSLAVSKFFSPRLLQELVHQGLVTVELDMGPELVLHIAIQ